MNDVKKDGRWSPEQAAEFQARFDQGPDGEDLMFRAVGIAIAGMSDAAPPGIAPTQVDIDELRERFRLLPDGEALMLQALGFGVILSIWNRKRMADAAA